MLGLKKPRIKVFVYRHKSKCCPAQKGMHRLSLQAEIADGSINEHGYDAYCPYDCQHRNQKLKWICACNWLWSKGVRNNWIHYLVDRAYACGDFWCPVHHDSGLMVSALGIKLNALSKLNGQINRKATIPHSRTLIHLGAFFKTTRKSTTARISQDAAILIFTIFKRMNS